MTTRFVGVVAVLLISGAVASIIAALLPIETYQALAARIRRPEDLTPERYDRVRETCGFLTVSLGVFGICLLRSRIAASAFVQEFLSGARAGTGGSHAWTIPWRVMAVLIVITGCALRYAELFNPLAYDEAYTYLNFARRSLPEAIGDYNSTNNHLLNTLLIHVTTRWFGPQEWAIRLPVFLLGSLLPAAVMVWASEWRTPRVAVLAGSLTAASPLLITYSADARGYTYVALAAIVFDTAMARLRRRSTARMWVAAWCAVVAGFCAMPIMLYAAAATSAWFLAMPVDEGTDPRFPLRLKQITLMGASAAVAIAMFYAPAYVFRGLMFLDDPIMQAASFRGFLSDLALGWREAFLWWTNGPLPVWGWLIAVGLGVWHLRHTWPRLAAPFAATLILNVVQHVTPPPRVYLHLASWIYLLSAAGTIHLLQWLSIPGSASREPDGDERAPESRSHLQRVPNGAVLILSLVVLASAIAYSAAHPVLIYPEDRMSYLSVPDVIERVHSEAAVSPEASHLLLAPLPTDLPSIFYMERLGFRIPMNEEPGDGQSVWLIARHDQTPRDVLASGLLRMEDHAANFDAWRVVERFETLTLYHATCRRTDG